jgi:hypothetical protein
MTIDGEWNTNPADVKKEAQKFFHDRFKEPWKKRPPFVCSELKKLSESESDFLVEHFTRMEVKGAVDNCRNDRAPGPDGFNFRFIKRFWDILGEDFYRVLTNFYDSGRISPWCASSFITLIPKCPEVMAFNDFRPINLIGCISKVISKVLANRLKVVIGSVISEEQSASSKIGTFWTVLWL